MNPAYCQRHMQVTVARAHLGGLSPPSLEMKKFVLIFNVKKYAEI